MGLQCDVHLWHAGVHTSADLISGVRKARAAGWFGELRPSPVAITDSGALVQPLRCQSVLEDFRRLFNLLLLKPLQKTFFTGFVGSAELETKPAFSRCWCENAEFIRCQSRSEELLSISVVYTNLH